MAWQRGTSSDLVILTERQHSEPVRTFLAQLRQLGHEQHLLRRINYEATTRLPVPQSVFVDIMSSEYLHTGALPPSIRATWETAPIMLFGSTAEIERMRFAPQMHDFVSLPVKFPELEARLRFAVWKIHGAMPSRDVIEANGIQMNMATHEVMIGRRRIELTYKEFELLRFFLKHPRRVFSRPELLEAVWETDFYGGTRTVDVHIRRLRAKLGASAGDLIHTVRNVGYRFG